ncbi:MAG: DEAD/DEAH box helicase [Blastocatellia bacterium]|nr:DEAD/DEAH box helicase [Blastocatellia bacterium]
MSEHIEISEPGFESLGLTEPLLRSLKEVGYEAPTPVQFQTIPLLKTGADVIGQAQTGTGKTAAFALPILEGLDLKQNKVQALVLVPTRELALQVAEAFHIYAKYLGHVVVLPVYGGQPIQRQTHRLEAGVHIVVGTPGRVMDHLRRGTLNFDSVRTVILDEADEMLKMGFIEDVTWIMEQASGRAQTALFSATMPPEIRKIADQYLRQPVSIEIQRKTLTVEGIEQRYLNVSPQGKLDTLTRVLEAEQGTATLVFAHTKIEAATVTEKLQARGYAAEAMHGDMNQAHRESVIRRLRSGQVEIVVATDVAARGLDVDRISHVINYDIPYDPESYVHRIGRTGRAGREGKAILFVTPRQVRLLREIERYTRRKIEPMKMPTKADIAARRVELFKESIRKTLAEADLELYLAVIEELVDEGLDVAEIAAAASYLARGERQLEAVSEVENEPQQPVELGMVRFYLDAGHNHGLRPNDVVGAIANEAGVPGRVIGAIDIFDECAYVEVPEHFKAQIMKRMTRTRIRNRITVVKPVSAEQETSWTPAKKAEKPASVGKSEKTETVKKPSVAKPAAQKNMAPPEPALEGFKKFKKEKGREEPGFSAPAGKKAGGKKNLKGGKPIKGKTTSDGRWDDISRFFAGEQPLRRKKKK